MMINDPENAKITICDEPCLLDESLSDDSSVTCHVAKLSTTYSNNAFSIGGLDEDLDSGVYFGTAEDNSVAFDGDNLIPLSDDNSECNIGMAFRAGHVGVLNQVKYFMRDMSTAEKNYLVDNT